jgi:hypothetical protein
MSECDPSLALSRSLKIRSRASADEALATRSYLHSVAWIYIESRCLHQQLSATYTTLAPEGASCHRGGRFDGQTCQGWTAYLSTFVIQLILRSCTCIPINQTRFTLRSYYSSLMSRPLTPEATNRLPELRMDISMLYVILHYHQQVHSPFQPATAMSGQSKVNHRRGRPTFQIVLGPSFICTLR